MRGKPDPAKIGLPLGSVLAGRYEILQFIGRGAGGWVLQAKDQESNQLVAIKIFVAQVDESAAEREISIKRFMQEVALQRGLEHRNIMRVTDYGLTGESPFIVLEYVEGYTLQAQLDQQGTQTPPNTKEENARSDAAPKDLNATLDIFEQLCNALAYAHSKGIVHRDVKPSNIMITADGTVKLGDFGVARVGDSQLTATTAIVGTAQYMAPEQLESQKRDGRAPVIDERTDIYQLGIVGYHLLVGRHPFEAETDATYIYRHLNDELPDPDAQYGVSIPAWLVAMLRKACAKAKQDRFGNVNELLSKLHIGRKLSQEGSGIQGLWQRIKSLRFTSRAGGARA